MLSSNANKLLLILPPDARTIKDFDGGSNVKRKTSTHMALHRVELLRIVKQERGAYELGEAILIFNLSCHE